MHYKPTGVCSQNIEFDIEDNKVKNVHFTGGCNGNLQGIARLCPDQLAQALKTAIGK